MRRKLARSVMRPPAGSSRTRVFPGTASPSYRGVVPGRAALSPDPWMSDERRALDHLFGLAYEELRRLAGQVRTAGDGETLSPTALVHEAWMRLAGSPELGDLSLVHFKRVAARAMRQVLVDAARRRGAGKRGGGAAAVTFDDDVGLADRPIHDLLELDAALGELARMSPRQATLVEARFFGGMETREAAEFLEISEATANRDWRAARAWLSGRLREEA
ncbi:MAG: RNA polymerase subunit sigma-70 [Gemmatimonadales bacterium]|nr:MAG: RNA polymerase subunit sigma-70 [Gemmatimonadales bacterium]